MTRTALVTGAHGFLGSHVAERLLREGWRVRALLSPWGDAAKLGAALRAVEEIEAAEPAETVERSAASRLERRRADLTDPASLAGVCAGVDVIIHAAALVREWGPWPPFHRTNVVGTAALLREAERAAVRRFVLVSSVAVFRYSGFRHAEARDRTRDRHDLPYARSKILAEDLVLGADLEGVVARPGLWPFGARDATFGRLAQAAKRGLLPLVGNGRAVVNTAYAPALAEGLIRCGEHPAAAGRSYVLGEPAPVAWNDLFTELGQLLGAPRPRLRLPAGPTRRTADWVEASWRRAAPHREPPLTRYRAEITVRDVHFDLGAAERELGWRSAVDWRRALAETVAWWRSEVAGRRERGTARYGDGH